MIRKIPFGFLLLVSIGSHAQILGGGTSFSNAVIFNQSWLLGCPSGSTTFSNQAAFEPTTTLDPCAPLPACAGGTTGSDVWFSFFAQSTTATITVNPSASFNIAVQAFSGSACPGLTDIGCIDAGGINVTETLTLTGLVFNNRYYFRVFGSANGVSSRTGTYTFCGSAGLGSTILPVRIISFSAVAQNDKVILDWSTGSESTNAYFEIERSMYGNQFETIGRVAGMGTTSQTTHYNFTDLAPFTTTNYYRLKQVDVDGRYSYSAILAIKVNSKLKKALNVSPNPVSDKISIRVSSDVASSGYITIINASGATIYQQTKNLILGENLFMINTLQNLSKGIYTVHVVIDGAALATKFISTK